MDVTAMWQACLRCIVILLNKPLVTVFNLTFSFAEILFYTIFFSILGFLLGRLYK